MYYCTILHAFKIRKWQNKVTILLLFQIKNLPDDEQFSDSHMVILYQYIISNNVLNLILS